MNSPLTQFVSSRRMGVYDPIQQINMWGDSLKSNVNLSASIPLIDEADIKFDSQSEDASHGILGQISNMTKKQVNLLIRYRDDLRKIERLLGRVVCGKRPMCSN
ncbi:hypothetical protein HN51_031088 [Arachis hypogaea]